MSEAAPHREAGEAVPSRARESRDVYATMALSEVPRLLACLDREPGSATHGCFDREYWAWKFRDFPLGMLQTAAYPLALAWRFPFPGSRYHESERLLSWISASLEWTLRWQHTNGAFDAFAPNEQSPGPTLGVLHGLCETSRLLAEALSPGLRDAIAEAVRRAAGFSLRREEDHGFVSNHWSLFAVAFLDAAELLGEPVYRERAAEIADRVVSEQSDEGWYREYGGPDPGYESLGIFHLAVYWRRTDSEAVLRSLRASVEFYAHCVAPDGSVGGDPGSRYTRLYFPGGFELLAPRIPLAGTVAEHMRARLARGAVVTPAVADPENLPSLLYTYLEAYRAAGGERPERQPPLPCEELGGIRVFRASGLTVVGTPSCYALFNGARGGVCRVVDRRSGDLAYGDAGYLGVAAGRRWTSHGGGLGEVTRVEDDGVEFRVTFTELRQPLLTPARLLLLRLLNLSLFRLPGLAAWLRRGIARGLMRPGRTGPLTLRRRVIVERDGLRFRDRITSHTGPLPRAELSLQRTLAGVHAGSAKYYHPDELEPTPLPDCEAAVDGLRRTGVGECEFLLEVPNGRPPSLVPVARAQRVGADGARRGQAP